MRLLICCCLLALTWAENQHTYYWRDYRGTIPDDAISFENLYIAQVAYNGLLPATLYVDKKEAVTECYGQRLIMKHGIKLLCDDFDGSFTWEYVNVKKMTSEKMKDYVIGGTEDNTTLFIGKVYHEGEWKIGKVFPPTSIWKGLRVWYNNGQKYVTDDFQILKYETKPIHVFELRDNVI